MHNPPSSALRWLTRLTLVGLTLLAFLLLPRAQTDLDLYSIHTGAADGWTFADHVQAGEKWHARGDFDRALEHWQAAWQIAPVDSPPRDDLTALLRSLTETHIARHQWDFAYITLRALVQHAPSAWAHWQYGLASLTYDLTQARRHLHTALTHPDPAGIPADQIPAITSIIELIDNAPPARPPWVEIGWTLYEYGQAGNADAVLSHAAIAGQNPAEAALWAALVRQAQGIPADGIVARVVQRFPQMPEVRYLEGIYRLNQRDYTASIEALANAILSAPQTPLYYATLADVYSEFGDLDSADYWLAQAVEIARISEHPDAERFAERLQAFREILPPISIETP